MSFEFPEVEIYITKENNDWIFTGSWQNDYDALGQYNFSIELIGPEKIITMIKQLCDELENLS